MRYLRCRIRGAVKKVRINATNWFMDVSDDLSLSVRLFLLLLTAVSFVVFLYALIMY